MPTASMVFDVIARDGASGSFRAIGKEAGGAGLAIDRLGKAAAGITVVFAAFAVNAAAKFESAMTRISTQAGVPIKDIKALGDSLLQLSPKVGFNPDELATSLYHVESAFHSTGISAKNAIDIVKTASQLSKIGNADLEITTQAIIGTLASGIKGISGPLDAAAQLNQLVGAGDTTLQKVALSIATGILPVAKTLGLSFNDVAAAIATTTDNVTPADEAATRLKTTLLTLIKPSKQQATAFEEIGLGALSLGQDFRKPDGLLVAVTDLKTHLDQFFPAGQKAALSITQLDGAQKAYYQNLVNGGTNTKDATKESLKFRDSLVGVSAETLRANVAARALGGSKTAGAFLTLIQEIDRLKSKYTDFGTAAQAAAKFQEAWANQQKTFKQKLDDLKASWDVFLIKAGNAILPTLKTLLDYLNKHPAALGNAAKGVAIFAGAWVALKIGNLISGLGTLATRLLAVGTAARTAGAEVATANIGAAGAGAGAASAGLGARLGAGLAGSALTRIAIPIGLTFVAIDAAKAADSVVRDLQKGHFSEAVDKGFHTLLAKGLTFGFNKSLDDLVHGKFSKALGDVPGVGLVKKLFGGDKLTAITVPVNFSGLKDGLIFINGQLGTFWKTVGASNATVADFNKTLNAASGYFDTNSKTLVGNSNAAQTNRAAIGLLVQKAKESASAEALITGKQSDYNAVLRLAIPALENAATALGFNKQQIDAVVKSLGLVLPPPPIKITVDAAAAVLNLQAVKDALDRIPFQKLVDIQVDQTGTASASTIALATQGGGHGFGFADGGINLSGRRGGIVQWAEAGGEAFIPLSPGKRSRSLNLWQQTGKLLGVPSMGNGGIRGGQTGPYESRSLMTVHGDFYASSKVDVDLALREAEFRDRVSRGFQ